MEVKQRGSGLGHTIILMMYRILGYRFVAFILNFVALYYVLFTPSVRASLQSYYDRLGLKLGYRAYFRHIKKFSLSIFDRFVAQIDPDELELVRDNRECFYELKNSGGVVLLSHMGAYAAAAYCLRADIPMMHIVMREESIEEIQKVEKEIGRENEGSVNIIDLNQGVLIANVQIANAIMNKEVVAMMVDRVVDKKRVVKVNFLGSEVPINRNPFEIALKLKTHVVAVFVVGLGVKKYNLIFEQLRAEGQSIEQFAQEYMNILEKMVKKYPDQWYNFYDFFNQGVEIDGN